MNSYYNNKKSVEEYINLSEGFDGSELIKKLKIYLPKKSLVLEIGSGPGKDFRILKNDYMVIGSDNSIEFLKRLKSNFDKDEFLNLDAITLKTEKKFDCIYSNKVLQHLSDNDLRKSILRQFDLLNDNGIICHSFWKGNGDEIFNGLLVNYQTNKTLRTLFQEFFDILILEEYNEFEDGDSLLLIGKKK